MALSWPVLGTCIREKEFKEMTNAWRLYTIWTKNLGRDDKQHSEDLGVGSIHSSDVLKGRVEARGMPLSVCTIETSYTSN